MRILVFGTSYVNTAAKLRQIRQWRDLHRHVNKPIDLLLVDSASPMLPALHNIIIHRFEDNIGHLSRGGKDGWGRAFSYGLQYAIENDYDYVVHVEGDSLCRLNFKTICARMQMRGVVARSAPVTGTRRRETDWLETGLMAFNVDFLDEIDFIGRYDWRASGKNYPNTPEKVIADILGTRCEPTVWKAQRDDVGHLNTLSAIHYDWISHTTPQIFDAYFAHYTHAYYDVEAHHVG